MEAVLEMVSVEGDHSAPRGVNHSSRSCLPFPRNKEMRGAAPSVCAQQMLSDVEQEYRGLCDQTRLAMALS